MARAERAARLESKLLSMRRGVFEKLPAGEPAVLDAGFPDQQESDFFLVGQPKMGPGCMAEHRDLAIMFGNSCGEIT
jgi:hypothetical protein